MSFCKCLVSCCIQRSQMFISNQSDLLSSTGCRYKDNNRNCPSWKARGYCTHTYQAYMRRNCQKSCFCGTSELIFSLTCPVYQISRVQSVCCLSFNNHYKYFTICNFMCVFCVKSYRPCSNFYKFFFHLKT